ncbi:MAG: hypothetical protein IT423_14715 [Pirellulaceae bacterium]|nr:hypothetical protein [Pirellulaceae bacterium]
MENRIQPILCCVGAEVAGEPTQFLMERAVIAAHLDWHVITVEVSAEQLETAWHGMQVMRFKAVRFFREHQSAALHLVAPATRHDLFTGGVTSALRVGSQWTMWHNSGPALVDLLASRLTWSDTICWLHGDSPRSRSFLLACCARPPREIIWTGTKHKVDSQSTPPSDSLPPHSNASHPVPTAASGAASSPTSNATSNAASSTATSAGEVAQEGHPHATESTKLDGTLDVVQATLQELVSQLPLKIVAAGHDSELSEWLTCKLSDGAHPAGLVHAGEMEARHLDILLACQPTMPCALAVVTGAPGARRKMSDQWRSGESLVISPADLVVAEEAYDQARWIGRPANIEILREAYDEYADF